MPIEILLQKILDLTLLRLPRSRIQRLLKPGHLEEHRLDAHKS